MFLLFFVLSMYGCGNRSDQGLSELQKAVTKEVVQPTNTNSTNTDSNKDESNTIDVGDVYRGSTVSRVFVYENKSGKKQTIAKNGIRSSCTCSSLAVDKQTLEPGEKTDIRMTVSLSDKYGNFDETGVIIWKAVDESIPIQNHVVTLSGNAVSGFRFTPDILVITKKDILEKKRLKIEYERLIDMQGAEVHTRVGHHSLSLTKLSSERGGTLQVSVKPEFVNDNIYTSINIWSHVRDQYSGEVNTIMGTISVRIENPEIVKSVTSSLKLRKVGDAQVGYKGYVMFRGNMNDAKNIEVKLQNDNKPITDFQFKLIKIASIVHRLDIIVPQKPDGVVDRNKYRLQVKVFDDSTFDFPVDFQ
ncbi:MAG: DUF1573 domain-containing protein [Planctomycetaceae bacterium]|jgi:hypothetical protein|nr:DUF1573 domain-containing protein [Planctomycetaceae bacterium]